MSPAPAFHATSQTLLQLLQPGQGFYVPVYQRSFTWGADQIDRLFEDIQTGLNRAEKSPGPPTFLGSVILFEGRSSVDPMVNTALPAQVLHVVDGQQRLTTLLLMLGQIRALIHQSILELEAIGAGTVEPWLLANLRTLHAQLTAGLWVDLPSAAKAYVRMPRLVRQATDTWGDAETNAVYESDIAFFLHSIAKEELDGAAPASPAGRPHLKLALDSIDEHLAAVLDGADASMLVALDFVADLSALRRLLPLVPSANALTASALSPESTRSIRLAAFAQFLLSNIIVIDVRAPDEETAFSLFEPLNTTGQPLTPIETLRPMAVVAEGGLDRYVGSASDKAFQRVSTYVPDELDATERAKRVSALLTSFALGQDGTKLAHNMLEQRRYLRDAYDAQSSLPDKRAFVGGIADTASFLTDVWEGGESPLITMGEPADRLALEVLRASSHVIVVPLLVRYYERAVELNTANAKKDFRSAVRATSAFWTLWRSSRSTTSGIDDIHRGLIRAGLPAAGLSPLARSMTATASLPPVKDVKKALRSVLASKLSVTDAASWSSLVNAQPIYETARVLARYILVCAHDDAIADRQAKGHFVRGAAMTWPTRSLEVWRGHYTVEHVAPRRKRSTDTSYDSAIYDEGDVNRLGNLTLLPPDLNDLVGNQPWPFKRDVFKMIAKSNPKQRVAALRKDNLYGLGARSKTLLESAAFIPFGRFIALNPAPTITRDYLAERGRRIAALAWDRLWADLN